MKNINFASRPYMYFSEQGNVDDDATFITIFLASFTLQSCCLMQSAICSLQMSYTAGASHHHGNSFKDTVNPLLSPPGGIFFQALLRRGLIETKGSRDGRGGGLFNLAKCINRSKVSQGRTCVTGRYTTFSNNNKMVTVMVKVRSAHEV